MNKPDYDIIKGTAGCKDIQSRIKEGLTYNR